MKMIRSRRLNYRRYRAFSLNDACVSLAFKYELITVEVSCLMRMAVFKSGHGHLSNFFSLWLKCQMPYLCIREITVLPRRVWL